MSNINRIDTVFVIYAQVIGFKWVIKNTKPFIIFLERLEHFCFFPPIDFLIMLVVDLGLHTSFMSKPH